MLLQDFHSIGTSTNPLTTSKLKENVSTGAGNMKKVYGLVDSDVIHVRHPVIQCDEIFRLQVVECTYNLLFFVCNNETILN